MEVFPYAEKIRKIPAGPGAGPDIADGAGRDIQVPSTSTAPVNPGTEQTDPQDKPDTPESPEEPEEPEEPDSQGDQDQYHTDPVPQGKPQPVEPEETKPDTSQQATCTISISCATILDNMDKCDESKRALIPAGGTILAASTVTFSPGESVFDVFAAGVPGAEDPHGVQLDTHL